MTEQHKCEHEYNGALCPIPDGGLAYYIFCIKCEYKPPLIDAIKSLNEYKTLKKATERLEEINKGLFNIIKAYHPEYLNGCSCPQCGDMPIYWDDILEGK